MLETDDGTLRKVAWLEIFPWLGLVRTFRVAISLRVLVLGAMGVVVTLLGWGALAQVFPRYDLVKRTCCELSEMSPWTNVAGRFVLFPPHFQPDPAATAPATVPILGPWMQISRPVWLIFRDGSKLGVARTAYLLLAGLWAIAVWALFGGAISRIAAVQLAADERIGWGSALHFALSKWLSYFAAPLLPLLGVVMAAIPVAILGLLLRRDVGVLLASLIWPLALLAGLIMALLLLGLGFGWPLMWATISTEGTDSFDALSRTYAYVFQRPLRYLFYVLVAGVIGWLGWLLVQAFAGAVIWLSFWAAGWGSGAARIEQIGPIQDFGGALWAGSKVFWFWVFCVLALAVGYFYGYFWTASSAIYLLLRRDVDATETDEVFLDADKSEPARGLPTLAADKEGAPVATDPTAEANGE